EVDSEPDAHRSQLWSPSAAARAAEVHRRSAVGGLDSGHDHYAAGVHRGLPRGQQVVLSPWGRGEGRGRTAVRKLVHVGGGHSCPPAEPSSAGFQAVSESWRLLFLVLHAWGWAPSPVQAERSSAGFERRKCNGYSNLGEGFIQ